MMDRRTSVVITTTDGNRHTYIGPDAEDVHRAVSAVMNGDAPSVIVQSRNMATRFETRDIRSVS
jgi:dihydroxyacetone kinase DhaKLM complex PTS-EIIA-like component DhaM